MLYQAEIVDSRACTNACVRFAHAYFSITTQRQLSALAADPLSTSLTALICLERVQVLGMAWFEPDEING